MLTLFAVLKHRSLKRPLPRRRLNSSSGTTADSSDESFAMQPDDSVARLIQKIKTGDDQAAQVLWDRYFAQLVRLAHQRLAGQNTRMADEEDIALSVLDSFIRAVADDHFPEVRDRNDLWRLLSVMTFRKTVDRIRHEQRQKRQAQGESAIINEGFQSGIRPMDRVCAPDPTPELAATLAEDCQRLLGLLEGDLQTMAVCKLEGYTNREIAEQCGCSVSTVERRLHLIRKKWRRELT
jgi:DNA-directed RNA polymerase specialized sigma24 family protein